MSKICDECKNKIGDGFPYGDVTCRADGKIKHESRKCDNDCFIKKTRTIDVQKEVAEEVWKLNGQILEKEIESLKCCGNCRHWYLLAENGEVIKYCNLKPNHDYQFRTDKCNHWQKL